MNFSPSWLVLAVSAVIAFFFASSCPAQNDTSSSPGAIADQRIASDRPAADPNKATEDLKAFCAEQFAKLTKQIDDLRMEAATARRQLKDDLSNQVSAAVAGLAKSEDLRAVQEDFKARIDEVASSSAQARSQLEQRLSQRISQLESQQSADSERLSKLLQAVETLTTASTETRQDVAALRAELNEQKDNFTNQVGALEEVLGAVTSRDSNANPTLAVRNLMANSPEFFGEMQQAVHQTLMQTGTLVIENLTPDDRWVRIEGNDFLAERFVLQGQQVAVANVPVGNVTIEVENGTRRNWTLGPPNYQQGIQIVPTQ